MNKNNQLTDKLNLIDQLHMDILDVFLPLDDMTLAVTYEVL